MYVCMWILLQYMYMQTYTHTYIHTQIYLCIRGLHKGCRAVQGLRILGSFRAVCFFVTSPQGLRAWGFQGSGTLGFRPGGFQGLGLQGLVLRGLMVQGLSVTGQDTLRGSGFRCFRVWVQGFLPLHRPLDFIVGFGSSNVRALGVVFCCQRSWHMIYPLNIHAPLKLL